MPSGGASFYAPHRALESLAGTLWSTEWSADDKDERLLGFRACAATLQHLPPRTAASVVIHPDEPIRSVEWATCVARYALYLARLHATEVSYCDGEEATFAAIPALPPEAAKSPRIVLPCTQKQFDSAQLAEAVLGDGAAIKHLSASLPTIELRVHDGSTVWAPKATVRLGVRCLQALWILGAGGRDVTRLTIWIRALFSAFWTWTGRPADTSDEEHAARILALSHRIVDEIRQVHRHLPGRLPRYPVYLRSGAEGFLALSERSVADLIDEPLHEVEAKLGRAYGLRTLPADEAPGESLDHRIAFGDELFLRRTTP